ncbi:MAG TPA: S24 family peptidase [Syntrophomonadaceae bacterium]|nr:S24 family peptidase [Syntrophomonadaceae bacterium]
MFLSPAEIIKQQIARLGERAVLDAVREITGGKASIELNDPDLQRMVSYLQKLFAVADEDTRVWARVQFARAFPPDILKEPGPTRNSTDREYVFPSVSSVVSEEASAYLPVLGEAAAGRPIYINEALEGYIPVPERYSRDRHFLLRAKGDSMVGAGIEAGDIVIVRPQPVVDEGDIAVFRIQKVGGAIKYYHRQNGTIILKSANPAYKDIVINPGQDIAVVGKVVSIIKRGDADQRMLTLTE